MKTLETHSDLVIASGQTESNVLTYEEDYKGADGFLLCGPGTLPETITIHVSPDGSNFFVLQSGGADINLTAGDATPITFCAWKSMKIVAGAAVAADRTFKVTSYQIRS